MAEEAVGSPLTYLLLSEVPELPEVLELLLLTATSAHLSARLAYGLTETTSRAETPVRINITSFASASSISISVGIDIPRVVLEFRISRLQQAPERVAAPLSTGSRSSKQHQNNPQKH
ncbi:hypothetical protein ACCO45_000086 [Purpureocillium lilacinum]|uniref:Uncharacterized protein n=1 Tax=Purpureocillium lilacinum TaxID=33203 RepID=A0ACC4E386_PURLI